MMAVLIRMIALSPTMEEGTILKWHVAVGDSVVSGKVLCEVETDKATMEYESLDKGTVLRILVPEGQAVRIGVPIAVLGSSGEDIEALVAGAALPVVAAAPPVPDADNPASAAPVPAAPASADGRLRASPLARKLALHHQLRLQEIRGSGPGGRIVKRDIEEAMRIPGPAAGPSAAAADATPTLRPGTLLPLSPMRKTIARRLSESKANAPHFYLTVTGDCGALLAARERAGRDAEKPTVNAFLMRIAAVALVRHPLVNAGWREEGIQLFPAADIGLAVALPDGLVTVVVRDCANKGILAIDGALRGLIGRARQNRLRPEEMSGAGFTISNLGSFGVEKFTAIINPPGSAILAVGRIAKQPVVCADDRIEVRQVAQFTLSCDHRVIDGAEGARFLATFKEGLEEPFSLVF